MKNSYTWARVDNFSFNLQLQELEQLVLNQMVIAIDSNHRIYKLEKELEICKTKLIAYRATMEGYDEQVRIYIYTVCV